MPKGNSIFDIYFAAESDPGKYEASKFGVQDIWFGFEHRDKMTKVKQENITNVVDSLQASIELGSTLYQGRSDRLQFESDLSTVSGGQDAIEVGSKGQKWKDMNWWDQMLSGGKQYQIGDKTYTKSDITVTAGVMKGVDLLEKTSLYDELRKDDDLKLNYSTKTAVEEVDTDQSIDVDPKDTAGTVIPTVKDDTPYKYKFGPGSGSKEWFDTKIKQFKQRNQRPEISGPSTGYNEQLERLAREQGWTGSRWE